MAVSVNTPILDQEILKLRRQLGDIYDESGAEMVLDTAGAGGIYLGNASLISTFKRDELLDCYNIACVRFLEYMVSFKKKEQWHKYAKGYIIAKSNIALLSSGGTISFLRDTFNGGTVVSITASTNTIVLNAGSLGVGAILNVIIYSGGAEVAAFRARVDSFASLTGVYTVLSGTDADLTTDNCGIVVEEPVAADGTVNIETLSPKLWWVIDAAKHTPTKLEDIGVEIPPTEYFSNVAGALNTRSAQLLYTIFNNGTNNILQFINYGAATHADLVYLKQHTNFVHDSATPGDVTVFTQEGLERVRILAFAIAQRYRSQEVRDLAEVDIRSTQEMDSVGLQIEKGL